MHDQTLEPRAYPEPPNCKDAVAYYSCLLDCVRGDALVEIQDCLTGCGEFCSVLEGDGVDASGVCRNCQLLVKSVRSAMPWWAKEGLGGCCFGFVAYEISNAGIWSETRYTCNFGAGYNISISSDDRGLAGVYSQTNLINLYASTS